MNYLPPSKTKEELYNEVVKRTGIKPVCLYMYGSRVYDNYQKDSDFDFIAKRRFYLKGKLSIY